MNPAPGLEKIRRARIRLVLAAGVLIVSVALFYTTPWPVSVRESIVLAGVAVYAVAALIFVFARCPRCGHLFHNVLGFGNPFSRHCSHCGLSLDDDDPGR